MTKKKKEKINRELSQPCLFHLHHLLDLARSVSRMFALIVHEDRDLAAGEQVPLAQYTMQWGESIEPIVLFCFSVGSS